MNNDDDINGSVFSFGGKGAPPGTANFTINLIRDTTEYGRQLVVYPKAHHPQMETIICLKGKTEPIFSLAACGFHQLALMEDVPEVIVEKYEVAKWAFRSSTVVNISSEILCDIEPLDSDKITTLTDDAVDILQQFLVLYAAAVWRIRDPLMIMIDPRAVQEAEYTGTRWFTFSVAFVMSVEQEEWEKLYNLKQRELEWATKVRDMAVLRAKVAASIAIKKSQSNH